MCAPLVRLVDTKPQPSTLLGCKQMRSFLLMGSARTSSACSWVDRCRRAVMRVRLQSPADRTSMPATDE